MRIIKREILLICIVIFATKFHFLSASDGKEINIIPYPKEVKIYGETIALTGEGTKTIIVIDGTQKSRIGASEINYRLKSLNVEPLSVITEQELQTSNYHDYNLILVGNAEASVNIKRYCTIAQMDDIVKALDEQGYIIHFLKDENKTNVIIIAGADEQGALYGCVTFSYLLFKQDDRVFVKKVTIRDWPDFKNRQVGDCGMSYQRVHYYARKTDPHWREKHIELQKKYLDWCLRHKINMVTRFNLDWVTERRFPDWPEDDFSWQRELDNYASERGIRFVDYTRAVYLGDTITHMKQYPDVPRTLPPSLFKDWDCGIDHDMYFCWSREEMHRKQAQAYAKALTAMSKKPFVWLHFIDGGPEGTWGMRCDMCKKKFGNDRAMADAYIANLYYQILKEADKDMDIGFCFWPYSVSYLKYADMEEYHKKMANLIPKDAWILLREGKRDEIVRFREIYKGHPIYFYFEDATTPMSAHWFTRSFFSPSVTQIGSFYFNNPKDILFLSSYGDGTGVRIFTELCAAEFTWNTTSSGATSFENLVWDFLNVGKPSEEVKGLIIRACKDVWGEAAGMLMSKIFLMDINANFICKPEETLQKENLYRAKVGLKKIEDIMVPSQIMAAQVKATNEAVELMDEILQSNAYIKPDGFPYFMHYFTNLHFLNQYAIANFHYLKAKELVIAGRDIDADTEINEGLKAINDGKAKLNKVVEIVKGKNTCYPNFPFRIAAELGVNLDILKNKIEQLALSKKVLESEYNIPEPIKTLVTNQRKIEAVKVNKSPVIDGKLDDVVWEMAKPVEYFVCYDKLKLARAQTKVRVLYDAENLYFGFNCMKCSDEDIKIHHIGHDTWFPKDDEVIEIFLSPGQGASTYVQLAANYNGDKFDCDYRVTSIEGRKSKEEKLDWNPEWTVRTSQMTKEWQAEVSIPFVALQNAPYSKFTIPSPGTIWKINLARDSYDLKRGELECSSIQYRNGEGFHKIDEFSLLIFK